MAAAAALGQIGDAKAVRPLTEALRHDKSEYVRQRGGASSERAAEDRGAEERLGGWRLGLRV